MKQEFFETKFTPAWDAFDQQLTLLEKNKRKRERLQIEGFAEGYRQICHHLALAQTRQYSPYLIDRLNNLALRGHQQLYQHHGNLFHHFIHFMLISFPLAIRKEYKLIILASVLFFGTMIVAGLLTYFYPALIYHIYPESAVREYTTMYNPESHQLFNAKRSSGEDFTMFGFYIKNNIGIGFQTFASGFILGIGALFNLLFNGVALGSVAGYMTQLGFTDTFFPFVIGHGAFELTGIAVAGAAGLRLGYGLLSPGRLSRKDALIKSAKQAIPLVYGTFLLLFVAAFVEAFWSSSSVVPNTVKYIVGAGFWVLVLGYFSRGAHRGA
ncbi:stage II sporulation protein M [Ketobacter sp. MCCC 1A13808]|uniref:stage II sporulation protein M n=1 Tax=Ketobacter sp. MCCC 1A13808 TaxID=2602738 RepID=UPI0012EBB36C|nr:stage II sporulation protein M [Ketobacter sp. MCCC 1A13808]MVF10772.1 stage II sporulation protein M [Ketobacter sp. MCCC 1A13808]